MGLLIISTGKKREVVWFLSSQRKQRVTSRVSTGIVSTSMLPLVTTVAHLPQSLVEHGFLIPMT